ncbi:MAG: non-ribosomal peptide synthetase, partial [bacterium]|nr:non-ribosomal peptide synthetase [bacterium]
VLVESGVRSGVVSSFTYKQVDEITDDLARLIISKYPPANRAGLQSPGEIPVHANGYSGMAGLLTLPSQYMIFGILGILKAGLAYVPLDPNAPVSRLKYILDECAAGLLVTTKSLAGKFSGNKVLLDNFIKSRQAGKVQSAGIDGPVGWENIRLDEDGGHTETRGTDLAYVIFTSGSTGKPKGVPISHGNICPLLHWGYAQLGLGTKDNVIRNLSYYFDWSVWEIFITITTGAALYIAPPELFLNPEACIDFINSNDITAIHATPGQYLNYVGLPKKPKSLDYLFLGAEKLTHEMLSRSVESVSKDCRIFNMYGPTEVTIISAVQEIDTGMPPAAPPRGEGFALRAVSRKRQAGMNTASVSIGGTVSNLALLVLDRWGKLCTVNGTGELVIGGDGVARGYLNDPGKSARSFVVNTFKTDGVTGDCLYKTGDRVRLLENGNIEFLGRIDRQVKLRGYRIELGEIESRLTQYPGVKEAVVLADERLFCAYIVPDYDKKPPPTSSQLKEHLSAHLPAYMVPGHYINMETMPLNANGKVDRNALPRPESGRSHLEAAYVAPVTSMEKIVAEAWKNTLELDKIGVKDNFFDLGGNSLAAVKVNGKLKELLNREIPTMSIFMNPTVGDLARDLEAGAGTEAVKAPPKPVERKKEISKGRGRLRSRMKKVNKK